MPLPRRPYVTTRTHEVLEIVRHGLLFADTQTFLRRLRAAHA